MEIILDPMPKSGLTLECRVNITRRNSDQMFFFIVLNSDNVNTVDEQIIWYEEILRTAEEKYIFVVLHHPPYTISNYHHWREKKEFQLRFRPLTMQHKDKITAIFTGHDHFASLYRINDLTWVHNGASLQHKSTYRMNEEVEDGIWLKTEWYYDESFHFVRLDIDEEIGTAKVSYIRASDRKKTCTADLVPEFRLASNCQE